MMRLFMFVCLSTTDEENSEHFSLYTLYGPMSPEGQLGSNSVQIRAGRLYSQEMRTSGDIWMLIGTQN